MSAAMRSIETKLPRSIAETDKKHIVEAEECGKMGL